MLVWFFILGSGSFHYWFERQTPEDAVVHVCAMLRPSKSRSDSDAVFAINTLCLVTSAPFHEAHCWNQFSTMLHVISGRVAVFLSLKAVIDSLYLSPL